MSPQEVDGTSFIDLLVLMVAIDHRLEMREAGLEKGVWIG